MSRIQPHILVGLFALLTLILVGAAIGRLVGLSAGEGAYLMVFGVAFVGWWIGRRASRQEPHR